MSLSDSTRARIERLVTENRVILFMKGDPAAPQCGFSATTSAILSEVAPGFASVNVLADPEIREGIKAYGNWPTIPQLYVEGELIGGCDIVTGMYNSGELHELFGIAAPDRTPPEITITERAAEAIREGMASAQGMALHLAIDARFQPQFMLKPASGGELRSSSAGITVHFDLASAQRARGIVIDWVESVQGSGLSIQNPNAPAQVRPLGVSELKRRIDAGNAPRVIDIRPAHERAAAAFPHPHDVLEGDAMQQLGALPKTTPLAFLCHYGQSSRGAAEHFRSLGFSEVYNIEGGIDAWSQQIDGGVPRY